MGRDVEATQMIKFFAWVTLGLIVGLYIVFLVVAIA
jgi:hypothetical protein